MSENVPFCYDMIYLQTCKASVKTFLPSSFVCMPELYHPITTNICMYIVSIICTRRGLIFRNGSMVNLNLWMMVEIVDLTLLHICPNVE